MFRKLLRRVANAIIPGRRKRRVPAPPAPPPAPPAPPPEPFAPPIPPEEPGLDLEGLAHWYVAGYEKDGEWYNPEKGDKEPSDRDLEDTDETVLCLVGEDGEKHYYTVYGGFDRDYTVEDAVEDLYREYQLEFT